MKNKKAVVFLLGLTVFVAGGEALAQEAVSPPVPRTHVERFSTPEARAARIESETTEKLAKTTTDAALFNERALARLRLQKYAEALADLQKAVALDARNADYRANLGYVLWKLGSAAEAISAEREALKLDEKNYTANYQLGRFLLRSGDRRLVKEAAERLKQALEIDPRQYEVRFELVAAFRELGETAAALGQLDILQEALPSDARVNYVAALLYVDRNDPKAAVEAFREALRKDDDLYGAWQDLGILFIKQGDWDQAETAFAALVKRQAASPAAAYFYALALYNARKPAAAEAEARRALRLNEGSAEARTLLGIILAAKGSADPEAIEHLTQAVALAPKNFDALFYLGRVQYLSKDYRGAVKNLRSAVELDNDHIEARFYLGTALEAAGEAAAALDEYRRLTALDADSAFGLIGAGALLLKQGKIDEAVAALEKAAARNPKNFEAHWALGRALFLKEDFTAALEALQTAVALAPARADARYQLGLTLRRLGRSVEAAREFAEVERLNKQARETISQ